MYDKDFMESLRRRFPEMQPIQTMPRLSMINGIGHIVCGERDRDNETMTYVTTLCFGVFFIPVFAIGSYRVADAPEGGWHFLGRVPISPFAKFWNCCVLAGVIFVIAFPLREFFVFIVDSGP